MAIKNQVQQGGYRIDSQLVAEAILVRMLRKSAAEVRAAEAQSECSKPSSVPAASTNAAPA